MPCRPESIENRRKQNNRNGLIEGGGTMINKRKDFHIVLDQQPLTVRFADANGNWKSGVQQSTERHDHSFFELQLQLKGSLMIKTNKETVVLCAMQGILIAPGVIHESCGLPGAFERRTLRLHFGNGVLKETLMKQGRPFWRFSVDKEMEQACRAFIKESETDAFLQTDMQQAEISRLLIRVFRKIEAFEELKNEDYGKRPDFRLDQIEEMDHWMRRNYMKRGGMPELAHTLTMSVRQLRRFIEVIYGMSFQEKITSLRMEEAALLLETSDMTVTQIGASVGYGAESTFYQTFRRHYSMTPLEYRKRHQKKIRKEIRKSSL